jgi:D-glycero-D-manno-heptose 1,7-bisphosphate phosphatase
MGVDSMSRRAVFLDRDGVLNAVSLKDGVTHPPESVDALEVLDGVPAALEMLRARELLRIVVTNQPDVARGRQTRQAVEAINQRLMQALPLDAVLTCYHDDPDRCACRKPKPGLFFRAAEQFAIDLGRSFMVGDRMSDVTAGRAAGCRTFLVRGGPGSEPGAADYEVDGLLEAARKIVELVDREGRRQ